MTWDEIKSLEQGVKMTNKAALELHEGRDIREIEFMCYDAKRDLAVVRHRGPERFSTVQERQAYYWEKVR